MITSPCLQSQSGEKKQVEIVYADFLKGMSYQGESIQRLVGNVQLLHNETYMTCDSASIFPNKKFEAYGRIVVRKDSTRIYGDFIEYSEALDMGNIYGKVVKLIDKNTVLRTQRIDFNTKDNIAYYNSGGTIHQNDNTIESVYGEYYSKKKMCILHGNVAMKNNDAKLKTDSMHYYTNTETAKFFTKTYIWHEEGIFTSTYGWYDKLNNIVYGEKDAYANTLKQEVWGDTIKYYRAQKWGEVYSNIQVNDTVQKIIAVGDYAYLREEPQYLRVTRHAGIAAYSEKPQDDTLFLRADTLFAFKQIRDTIQKEEGENVTEDITHQPEIKEPLMVIDTIKSSFVDTLLSKDSVRTIDTLLNLQPKDSVSITDTLLNIQLKDSTLVTDTLVNLPPKDTSSIVSNVDSLSIVPEVSDNLLSVDSLNISPLPKDTTLISNDTIQVPKDTLFRYIVGYPKVRYFHKDIQGICDSITFSERDSLTELFYDPILWNENHQITADKIEIYSKNSEIDRVEMINNGFIAMLDNEKHKHFNQIKGTDMVCHFRNNELYLVDVFQNGETLYYLRDSLKLSGINKAQSTDIKIWVENRKIKRIDYLKQPKSNVYPPSKLPQEERVLKGLLWQPEKRPKSKKEIISRSFYPSLRNFYNQITLPEFPITDKINKLSQP